MGSIQVQNLGKAYKIYPSRYSRFVEWIFPWLGPKHQLRWVLQDINFSVDPGEAVGIVGVNGAGKSTLLKLITGTTQATSGGVQISGRVSALLELGMGFHPDFTGRQNVYMAAQLLGIPTDEINVLLPHIEKFAEIGNYFDQPVRVYSSGMQMRLAFSVATAKRPDLLVVDEALSIGDAYFQHKSLEHIRLLRQQGTTLLIVSHDKFAIQSICDRAILLDRGRIAREGIPEEVMDYYNAMLAERGDTTVKQELTDSGKVRTISGTGDGTVSDIALLNEHDERIEVVGVGQRVTLKIVAQIHADLPELVLGYLIKDRLGQSVFGTNTDHLNGNIYSLSTGEIIEYYFTFDMNLGVGSYSIATALHTQDTHVAMNYEWRDLAFVFNVVNYGNDPFVGTTWLQPRKKIKRLRCSGGEYSEA